MNESNLPLEIGDIVAVEASPGHDIGIVSMLGELVNVQLKKMYGKKNPETFGKIYRKAKPSDIEKWREAKALEHKTMIRARQIAKDLKLNMKIGDVEFLGAASANDIAAPIGVVFPNILLEAPTVRRRSTLGSTR